MNNNANVAELSTTSLSTLPAIKVVEIKKSRKSNALADVSVSLSLGSNELGIADFRVLRNKQGQLWVAPPAYSVTVGKAFEYFPVVTLSVVLKRAVDDEILRVFEMWEKSQQSGMPAGVLSGEVAR